MHSNQKESVLFSLKLIQYDNFYVFICICFHLFPYFVFIKDENIFADIKIDQVISRHTVFLCEQQYFQFENKTDFILKTIFHVGNAISRRMVTTSIASDLSEVFRTRLMYLHWT